MEIQHQIQLKQFNSFGIDSVAEQFARFDSIDQARELLAYSSQVYQRNQLLILGGGSNMLFTGNVSGLVLKNEIAGIELVKEDEQQVYVKAGAGVNWHQLVLYCIKHNLAGMENLSLIPGNVGASPMQNIGAYGVEIKDIFYELEALHIEDRKLVKFGLTDCEFGYRESVFKRKYKGEFIITSVTYRLNKVPVYNISYGAIEQELTAMGIQQISIAAVSQAVINIRSSKLPNPAEIGNAGSFFKNPEVDNAFFQQLKNAYPAAIGYPLANGNVKLAAGWLIEQCGWKGYRKGDAGCHVKQALVLVNYGNATGAELLSLSNDIIASVQLKFGVLLDQEVNIL